MLLFGTKIIDYDNAWIFVEDALQEGIRGLRCPFCDTSLIAQKRTKDKPAHFKHRKRACRYVRLFRRLVHYFPIPAYWQYGLSVDELRLLNRLRRKRDLMEDGRFISYHQTKTFVLLLGREDPIYGFDKLGKTKYDYVEKLLKWKLIKIRNHQFGVDIFELSWKAQALWAKDWSLKKYYLEIVDYWESWLRYNRWDDWTVNHLFHAMERRMQKAHFYLLKIKLDGYTIYKTGTTTLPYEKIEKWERKMLKGQAKRVSIEQIYFVDSIALAEPFIRLKYKKYAYSIDHLTGYFDFKNKLSDFRQDLHQVILLTDFHKEKIKKGLQKAVNVGKRGKENISDFLAKPKNRGIIALLEDSEETHSVRAIARYMECSINTVRKVKGLWEKRLKCSEDLEL